MPFDPTQPMSETNYGDRTQMINGQPYVWVPDQTDAEQRRYLGEDVPEADYGPGEGPGSWVPASFKNPNGTLLGPSWMLPAMLAGPAIASGIGAAFGGGGAAAATPAAAQAAASAPEAAAAAGLPAGVSAATGLPTAVSGLPAGLAAGGSTAVPVAGLGGAGPVIFDPAAAAASVPSSTLQKVGQILKKVGPYAKAAGAGVGAATDAAARNRSEADQFALDQARLMLQREQLGLSGYNANVNAQTALEAELMRRAEMEGAQRKTDLANIYKQSVAQNPARSPYDPKGAPGLSQAYLDAVNNLARQGGAELAQDPEYRTRNLARPTYTPYTQPAFTPPQQKKAGTLERIGNWLSPILTGIGAFGR